ncbi:MAG TPA: septum formation initiator family protein [Actinomycetota bacterium]|nr:septum formation initiator family protein [Actinomycetota bacterium]
MSARATATSPAAPQSHGKSHRKSQRAGTSASVRPSGRAAILLLAVFLLAMVSIAPTRVWLDQRSRLRDLERQAAQLEAANARLAERIADLRDPETLERLARECLGMVEPGEIAFITVPRDGAPTPPPC